MGSPTVVTTLIGHAQMSFAVPCLQSLLVASADPIQLRIHDDGTLTSRDLETLQAELRSPEIVLRGAADGRFEELETRYPRCASFRRTNPLGLKLIDIAHWSGGDTNYCDADILFVRRFAGLFRPVVTRAVFMRDRQQAYALRPRHLLATPSLQLAARLNSGVVVAPRSLVDLDRVEWFLGLPDLRPSVWVEQTCWAMLAAGQCDVLDERQFAIPGGEWPDLAQDPKPVALHFVSPVRSLLTERLERLPSVEGPVGEVRSEPAGTCGPLALLAAAVARRLSRERPMRRA